jgi:hypothetical protein
MSLLHAALSRRTPLRPPCPRRHKAAVAGIRRLITMLRGHAWTLHQSGRVQGSAGLPDMFAVVGTRAFWIEVKTGNDKLRPEQQNFIARVEACGMSVVVGSERDVAAFLTARDDRLLRQTPGART